MRGAEQVRCGQSGRPHLATQAQRVSAALNSVAAMSNSLRDSARAAASEDPNLAAGLAAELKKIDADEASQLSTLRSEVYIGLHELSVVSPPALATVSCVHGSTVHELDGSEDAAERSMQELEDEFLMGWEACSQHRDRLQWQQDFEFRLQLARHVDAEVTRFQLLFAHELGEVESQLELAREFEQDAILERNEAWDALDQESECLSRANAEIANLRAQLQERNGQVNALHAVIRENCMTWKDGH